MKSGTAVGVRGVAMGQPPISDFSFSLVAKSDGVRTTDSSIQGNLSTPRWPTIEMVTVRKTYARFSDEVRSGG